MHRRRSKESVEQPHAFREFRPSKNPPAAQPAQSESLSQTAGDDKLITQMKRSSRRVFKQRFHVNLVNQHTRTNTARNLSDLFDPCFVDQHAARIVKIGEYYQTRLRRHERLELFRHDLKSVLKPPRETFYSRAEIQRRRQHRFVRRMLEQDLVTRIDEGGHCEMICERCSCRRHDRFRSHSVSGRDRLDEQLVTVTTIRDLEIVKRHTQLAQ